MEWTAQEVELGGQMGDGGGGAAGPRVARGVGRRSSTSTPAGVDQGAVRGGESAGGRMGDEGGGGDGGSGGGNGQRRRLLVSCVRGGEAYLGGI
ncbi:hypothetical protein E2562_023090 [Oryza meyeriana var. granulata]|uniref:DUF834 domain-containing protein n=1 Tax=Oryza meyeriana var. granulata TaxID=110450 RepID=A0A6G1EP29_9ORYZ|nr:hypothetical protein E2562_023090 [Oryza meyeriana var. granulata]